MVKSTYKYRFFGAMVNSRHSATFEKNLMTSFKIKKRPFLRKMTLTDVTELSKSDVKVSFSQNPFFFYSNTPKIQTTKICFSLRIYFLRNETKLSWTFPVIKIRFSLSTVLIRGESNPLTCFD